MKKAEKGNTEGNAKQKRGTPRSAKGNARGTPPKKQNRVRGISPPLGGEIPPQDSDEEKELPIPW